MFSGLSQAISSQPLSGLVPKEPPPPTSVVFPKCAPKTDNSTKRSTSSLLALLQAVHRPSDVNLSHFEALGLHVEQNVSPEQLLPDSSFLPPVEEWNVLALERVVDGSDTTKRPLSNGNLSPGVKIYRERQKELLIDNNSAFRTIRRVPQPAGESAARLGNAYEFYKNLEYFSGFWADTSYDSKATTSPKVEPQPGKAPAQQQGHTRHGAGSQLPPEYRQNLLTAFVKLVAYDFGCNVSFARREPRLHLTPSSSSPASYFNSSATFVYRTPTDRSSARAGIVEGPVAALSARGATVFATEAEERLDLAREVVTLLLTAQQRAREHKREIRFGKDRWWTSKPRWGGGPGGPIGKEGDKDEIAGDIALMQEKAEHDLAGDAKQKIGGIDGSASTTSPPSKRPRRLKDGNMAIYQPYRKLAPPSSTWDRKARYCPIGKVAGSDHDDIFLVSALNHHICVLRARVPQALLGALDGEDRSWDRLCVWRSRWYDMFLKEERVSAMNIVWGMMQYLMRKVEGGEGNNKRNEDKDGQQG